MEAKLFKTNLLISQLILNGLIDEAEELVQDLTTYEKHKLIDQSKILMDNKKILPIHKSCMKIKIELINKNL